MKRFLLVFICLFSSVFIWGETVENFIDSLINEMLPVTSDVGIAIYDLSEGELIYSYRGEKLSRPASTQKLLTAISFLSSGNFGDFTTEVWCDGTISNDTLKGNLYVKGGFDPEFDDKDMNDLVDKIPFNVIEGRVYGDISMKDSLYWGHGWVWDDNPASFQPYLSPLMFCKGSVKITAYPTLQGEKANIVCLPQSSFYTIENNTKTNITNYGKFHVTRNWLTNGNRVEVGGSVEKAISDEINIYDSSGFFMHTFVERLRRNGKTITKDNPLYQYKELPLDSVSRIVSVTTPINEVLKNMLKESDNLNAEAMLYKMAYVDKKKKHVSAKDGIERINSLIKQLGYNPKDYKITDGSGLSNYNYISPVLLVGFLKYAYNNKELFNRLYNLLPIGGRDGTLKNRMGNPSLQGKVHAKTGTVTGINSLAGYLKTNNGHFIAFAIMHQNIMSYKKARAFQDKVCEFLILNR